MAICPAAEGLAERNQRRGSWAERWFEVLPPPSGRGAPDLTDLVHGLVKSLIDPYRPELHYMRGPGPKWRAKHERAPRAAADAAVLAPAWFGKCSRRSGSSATSRVAANGSNRARDHPRRSEEGRAVTSHSFAVLHLRRCANPALVHRAAFFKFTHGKRL